MIKLVTIDFHTEKSISIISDARLEAILVSVSENTTDIIETKYNSSEASFIAADGFRILTDEADVIALPFNRLSIAFKVESIKSLTFNYK